MTAQCSNRRADRRLGRLRSPPVQEVATFLVADLVAGQPVLPSEGRSNAWIGCVGLRMTAVFVGGIVLRPQRRHLGLGLDSWVALLIYALGVWGLLVVSG